MNTGTLPVPVDAKPTAALEFTQLKVVPPIGPSKGTIGELMPSHKVILFNANTDGSGFTTIWKVSFAPAQLTLFAVNNGETMIVALMGATPGLDVTNAFKESIPPSD
jgi:hypothetical protein